MCPYAVTVPTELFTATERKLLWAIPIVGACLFSVAASFNFVFDDMSMTFAATQTQQELMRSALSVGALLAVFPAGVLGAKIGERRLIVWCAVSFTLGALILLVTPIAQGAFLGLTLAGAGRIGMFIAGLSLLTKVFTSKDRRAVGISRLSMAIPAASVIMPLLAGALAQELGWRSVALVWIALGVVAIVIAMKWLPKGQSHGTSGEMVTPTLAALALTSAVQWLSFVTQEGPASPKTLGLLAIFICSLVGLVIAMRRMAHPSMSFAPLRMRGVAVFAIVVLLLGVTNFSFVISMTLQKLYHLTAESAAVLMLPAQLAALFGAFLAASIIRRSSIRIAGLILMAGLAASMFASLFIVEGTPVWVPIVIVTCYSMFLIGAGVPAANAIMNSASKGSEDAVASYRAAASNLGTALGVAVFTVITYGAANLAFTASQGTQGYEQGSAAYATNAELAADLYVGNTQDVEADEAGSTGQQISDTTASEVAAMIAGVRTQGILGGAATCAALAIFGYGTRRRDLSIGPGSSSR